MVIKLSQRNSHFRVEKVKGKGTSGRWFSPTVFIYVFYSIPLASHVLNGVHPAILCWWIKWEWTYRSHGRRSFCCCCQICLHNVSRAWARQTSFWWYASTHQRTTHGILIKIKTILLVFEIFSPLGWFHAMTCVISVLLQYSHLEHHRINAERCYREESILSSSLRKDWYSAQKLCFL